MYILGCAAVALILNALGKKLYDYIEENSYDQSTNSCSILDYEIADRLA